MMVPAKYIGIIWMLLLAWAGPVSAQQSLKPVTIDFFGEACRLPLSQATSVPFSTTLSADAILDFDQQMQASGYDSLVQWMLAYRNQNRLDDWLYYQLLRKAAEVISPKRENYIRYTLYKWYLLRASGYDAQLAFTGDTILFYVHCDETIYDIPYFTIGQRQYVCLNYHDYGSNLHLETLPMQRLLLPQDNGKAFSYKLTQVPEFRPSDYKEKDIAFAYQDVSYRFRLRVNEQLKNVYANYPVADYPLYFNAPMSRETYNSFVPKLKEVTRGMSMRNGIDYLMRFTRYAFLYQPDKEHFGREKRLSPEQTLLYDKSDCEDRAALFFFLVKEIYNLPMIVVAYPTHVTVAVKLQKGRGTPILYNGEKYYICEPTPQARDLDIGEVSRELRHERYEVAYVYHP